MAFDLNRWSRVTDAMNTGLQVIDAVNYNGPAQFTYASSADNSATIAGANYFAPAVYDLAVGDYIWAQGSDTNQVLTVATINRAAGTITTTSTGIASSIGTSNIVDGAVTSAKVSELLIQHAQVDVPLATLIGSFTTSALLVAAPGANQKLILHRATLWVDYGGTVLANGGAVGIQYNNTANQGGVLATNTLAAATLIAATADTTFGFSPVNTTLVDSTTLNEGLYLATATADFTGGTSSVYKVDLWYSVLDVA